MGAVIDARQAGDVDVGVALGCRQAGVAEQLLYAAQVGATLEEVGREAVPQLVGMHAAPSASGDPVSGEATSQLAVDDAPAAGAEEEGGL
jgi:hypothetical protein